MKYPLIEKARSHLFPAAVLLTLTFIVYRGVFWHQFLLNWDDVRYVVENEAIRGITWEHLRDVFSSFYVGNYAPVQMISYMVDYSIWGLRPGGFLFTNILLHALNGVLFYYLLVRISGKKLPAFLASFIFLFHPVQVESVAWISQRKTLLAMFFSLSTFHLYLSYLRGGRGTILKYGSSLAALVLALLSKSVAVIVPLVLILYDICYLEKRDFRVLIANKIPFILAVCSSSVVAMLSQRPELSAGRTPYLGGSPLTTLFTMLPVVARYLGILLWPADLSAVYMIPIRIAVDSAVVWSALLCVILCILGAFLYHRQRDLFFWYSLFFVGLLPVSQIIPLVTLMNDRYLYFPMLGASTFFVAGALQALKKIKGSGRKMLMAVLSIPLLVLPWLSIERIAVWQNDLTLWLDATNKAPHSADAWFSLGVSFDDSGQEYYGLLSYLKALTIDPDYEFALKNIGGFEGLIRARPLLIQTVGDYPLSFEGLMNLGTDYLLSGDFSDAESTFSRALSLKPGSPFALFSLGNVYLGMKDPERARVYYEKAVESGGENAVLAYRRACAEALSGRQYEALKLFDRALRLGYRDRHNIENNPDLASLRSSPEFQKLLQRFFGR